MSGLSLFGLFAVTAMHVFYALENRSPWFILAFALACLLGSATDSCREHGHSELSKRSGHWLHCAAGDRRHTFRRNRQPRTRGSRKGAALLQ